MDVREDMVLVEWHDATFFPGTYNEKAIREHQMVLFKRLGYLIAKDDTTTFLALEQNDQEEYRDITLIPSNSILSIHKLYYTKPIESAKDEVRKLKERITELEQQLKQAKEIGEVLR